MDETLHHRLSRLVREGARRPERVPLARPAASALPAGREVRTEHGAFYLVERPLEEALRDGKRAALRRPASPWRIAEGDGDPREVERPVFFDLETTGFTSCPLFLAATIDLRGGIVRQRFARDYAEEKAVVAATAEEIACAEALVSYNGRSYDLPFLRHRAAMHRLPFSSPPAHLDLLHLCRRTWRGRFPDFRLQTIEKALGRADRAGDVPGAEIPALYHEFVRRGHDPRMAAVFRHNLEDVLTLVRLFFLLAEGGKERRGER
ncbi:MAG: ribonuclease H-like domain-containing protein [Candidatus Eisenbacteria bacterium]